MATYSIVGLPELEAQLSSVPELLTAELGKATTEAVAIAEVEIQALTPRKTGRLFAAWEPSVASVGGQWVGHVGNNEFYAPMVEHGTRAHDIVAKGKALMIPPAGTGFVLNSGQTAFFRSVRHPGSTAAHMARQGLANAKDDALSAFKNAVARVLATVRGALP